MYKKRLGDLEIGIVLGRQNYALKSIACEKVGSSFALSSLSSLLSSRSQQDKPNKLHQLKTKCPQS